jgi:hypothetical protein
MSEKASRAGQDQRRCLRAGRRDEAVLGVVDEVRRAIALEVAVGVVGECRGGTAVARRARILVEAAASVIAGDIVGGVARIAIVRARARHDLRGGAVAEPEALVRSGTQKVVAKARKARDSIVSPSGQRTGDGGRVGPALGVIGKRRGGASAILADGRQPSGALFTRLRPLPRARPIRRDKAEIQLSVAASGIG